MIRTGVRKSRETIVKGNWSLVLDLITLSLWVLALFLVQQGGRRCELVFL